MTTIGTSLVITGEVTSKEDITIHGQVKGQISMVEGTLLVAPTARIACRIFHQTARSNRPAKKLTRPIHPCTN